MSTFILSLLLSLSLFLLPALPCPSNVSLNQNIVFTSMKLKSPFVTPHKIVFILDLHLIPQNERFCCPI